MPATTGHAPPTSSSAIASERLRSSRVSEDTSAACPLATMPVTPRVSASQRRCRRYAGSSIARSAVKGSTLAGMTPEKRSGRLIAPSSRARDLVGDFLTGHDAAVGTPDDVEGGPLDLGPERRHAVLDHVVTRYSRWSAPITVASTQMSIIVPVTTSEVTFRAAGGS